MALIKAREAQSCASGAVVLDLGDLARQAEALRERARAQAERIIEEAHQERARIMQGAAEEGRRQGYERGLEEGRRAGAEEGRALAHQEQRERFEALAAGWGQALDVFMARREEMFNEARRGVVHLASVVASKVARRVVELDAEAACRALDEALSLLARRTRVRVRINPADREAVEAGLPGVVSRLATVDHAELVEDESVARGGCLIETESGGLIDATVDTQVERLVSLLVAGEAE